MLLLYEYRKKTVLLRIMNLALMKFSLLPCGLKHTTFIYLFFFKNQCYSLENSPLGQLHADGNVVPTFSSPLIH